MISLPNRGKGTEAMFGCGCGCGVGAVLGAAVVSSSDVKSMKLLADVLERADETGRR